MSRTRLAAACAALLTLAAAGTAEAKKPSLPSIGTYELRVSMQMKSDFKFQNDPVGCNGNKPMGYDGEGHEIMNMSSPKPVLVQTVAGKGFDPSVMRKDLKPAFEVRGTSNRTGSMTQVVCDTSPPSNIEPCLGDFPVHDALELRFYAGPPARFQISTNTVQDTHSLIAGCGNSSFDWDGATARTGYVLTHVAEGSAPLKKFRTGSFSLRAFDREKCVPTDFGADTGSCETTWSYKVNFRKRKH